MNDARWIDLAEEAGQLREAMAHRAPIEQAKGALAVLRGCSPERAFEELRQVSNDHNVKVHELASALVDLVATRASSARGPDLRTPAALAAVHAWGAEISQADGPNEAAAERERSGSPVGPALRRA